MFLCATVLTIPSTRSWFSLWGFRLFLPWPSCLTLDLAPSQLALDSVLANSVMFSEISMGDAVAAVPSGGQHVMRSRPMTFPWCRFGADRSVGSRCAREASQKFASAPRRPAAVDVGPASNFVFVSDINVEVLPISDGSQPGNRRVVQHGAKAAPRTTRRTGCTWYGHNQRKNVVVLRWHGSCACNVNGCVT